MIRIIFIALLLFLAAKHVQAAPPVTLVFKDKIAVYMPSEIGPVDDFLELIHYLEHAPEDMSIEIYLSGYGGRVQTAVTLINAIQAADAPVTMIVVGPVYSAHAFLALSGDHLVLQGVGLLMFHHSSALNSAQEYCARYKGEKDRGQDAYKKCLKDNIIHLQMVDRVFEKLLYKRLTKAEIQAIFNGHDVYITFEEMRNRLK